MSEPTIPIIFQEEIDRYIDLYHQLYNKVIWVSKSYQTRPHDEWVFVFSYVSEFSQGALPGLTMEDIHQRLGFMKMFLDMGGVLT
jgi:hypothetical protein